jgi:hypothetical protein
MGRTSVIFDGTLSRNARRTAGRSAKIRCIFSFDSAHDTVSVRPSRVPLTSPSSALETPATCAAPFFATAASKRCSRSAQNCSSVTAPLIPSSSVPSSSAAPPSPVVFPSVAPLPFFTSVACSAASSGFAFSSAARAASVAAESEARARLVRFDAGARLAATTARRDLSSSLSASRSLSSANVRTIAGGFGFAAFAAAAAFAPGGSPPRTSRSDGFAAPALFL